MSAQPRTWTGWFAERVASCRPISKEDIAYQRQPWRAEWRGEIEAAADRREEIPMPVARSYARHVGVGAARNLRATANAEAIALALFSK